MHTHEIPPIILIFIASGYWVIGLQFYKLTRDNNINADGKKALIELLFIFLTCSFSGYLSHFVPSKYNNYVVFVHIILGALAWRYAIRNEAAIVIKNIKEAAKND